MIDTLTINKAMRKMAERAVKAGRKHLKKNPLPKLEKLPMKPKPPKFPIF